MIAEKLAEFINRTRYEDLPENVVAMAKNCIIDWLGSVLTGSQYPPAQKVKAVSGQSTGEATLMGSGQKGTPMLAAYFNGAASHTVELDDLHRKSMLHPGAAVISAAWPAAEISGSGGKDLITAVVLGYETAIRTAESVAPSHFDYWYPTGSCGIFGAAASAAKLLHLDNRQVVSALGNAGSQAGGLWEFHCEQVMSKQLSAAKAAMDGLSAALLAREGFTGPTSIFEGNQGFLKAYSQRPHPALLEQGLGDRYKISEISFKLYPSGRHTHGGIDLALRLRNRGIQPEDVELVRIKTYKLARELVGNPDPYDPVEAKFSLPFCVASTLVFGLPTLRCFCQERIDDDQLRRVMAHITVEVDPGLELLYPNYWPTVIEIIDRDSHIIKERTDYPKGDPENPAAPPEIHQKFLALASKELGGDKAEALLGKLLKLEEVENINNLTI